MAITSEPGSEYFPALSPDASSVAYVAAAEGETDDALMVKSRDPAARALTLVPARAGVWLVRPIWSPDSTRIAYDANVAQHPGQRHVGVVGVGEGARTAAAVTTGRGTNVAFEFMTYPGEFHYFTRAHVLRDAWGRAEAFFRQHLNPGT